jgi:hypothetical protein
MRLTILFAALALSLTAPQVSQAATVETCPSDNYLYPEPTMEEVCGPVPQANCRSGDGACFAAHEPVSKQHQLCRTKYFKDDKERKEHNALVRRCHGKKVEDQQQKPKSKPDPQGKASDALKAALEDAKRKTESSRRPTTFKDEQEQIRKEGQSHIKQQQQTYQQELAAERSEVERLKSVQEANKQKIREQMENKKGRDSGRPYEISCDMKVPLLRDKLARIKACAYRHCPMIKTPDDAFSCQQRVHEVDYDCFYFVERLSLEMNATSPRCWTAIRN